MSSCHPGKFSKTGGKCPTVTLANFQKWKENVRLSPWQIFKNGRKMSDSHPGKSSRKGGKCPTVILTDFQKREENVRLSSLQIFKNRNKMSVCLFLTSFQKQVEYVCMSDLTIFCYNYPELGGSSLFCHYDNFLETGGKFLEIPIGELNARKINVQGDIVQGELNSRRIFHLGE